MCEYFLRGKQTQIGKEHQVLVIGESRRNPQQMMGRTSCFRMTIFEKGDYLPGDIVTVKVKRATSHTLFADVLAVANRAPMGMQIAQALSSHA